VHRREVFVTRTGWLLLLPTGAAAWLFHRAQHNTLFWLAVIVAIAQFWSLGIMHNHAYVRGDPLEASDWVTVINMLSTLAGLALLLWAALA